ncbi:MAG: HD domain-containing protein, partial [Myxococcota bacterium]
KFFQKVLELKNVPRQGWKEKLEIINPESVAEHSYSTATISMVLSDLKGLNTEKIIKMALLHDLAESIIGDIIPCCNAISWVTVKRTGIGIDPARRGGSVETRASCRHSRRASPPGAVPSLDREGER